jgi:hypothetical protein
MKPRTAFPFLLSVSQFESLSLFFRRPKNHPRKLKHRDNELNNAVRLSEIVRKAKFPEQSAPTLMSGDPQVLFEIACCVRRIAEGYGSS